MDTRERTVETGNEHRNLARVLRDARWEAEACTGYVLEAETAGDERLASFFQTVQRMYKGVAEQAEKMLATDAGKRSDTVSARKDPDPGDVSPEQAGT